MLSFQTIQFWLRFSTCRTKGFQLSHPVSLSPVFRLKKVQIPSKNLPALTCWYCILVWCTFKKKRGACFKDNLKDFIHVHINTKKSQIISFSAIVEKESSTNYIFTSRTGQQNYQCIFRHMRKWVLMPPSGQFQKNRKIPLLPFKLVGPFPNKFPKTHSLFLITKASDPSSYSCLRCFRQTTPKRGGESFWRKILDVHWLESPRGPLSKRASFCTLPWLWKWETSKMWLGPRKGRRDEWANPSLEWLTLSSSSAKTQFLNSSCHHWAGQPTFKLLLWSFSLQHSFRLDFLQSP